MLMGTLTCPHCQNTSGDSIVGIEVRGVYDGVLYWMCTLCGLAWSRDWSGYGRRADIAASMVEAHNMKPREQ